MSNDVTLQTAAKSGLGSDGFGNTCHLGFITMKTPAWSGSFAPPAESGIMDWGGALRRMFCSYTWDNQRPSSELDDTSGNLLSLNSRTSHGIMLMGWGDDLDYDDDDYEEDEA